MGAALGAALQSGGQAFPQILAQAQASENRRRLTEIAELDPKVALAERFRDPDTGEIDKQAFFAEARRQNLPGFGKREVVGLAEAKPLGRGKSLEDRRIQALAKAEQDAFRKANPGVEPPPLPQTVKRIAVERSQKKTGLEQDLSTLFPGAVTPSIPPSPAKPPSIPTQAPISQLKGFVPPKVPTPLLVPRAPSPEQFGTPEDVRTAVINGVISKEEGASILKQRFKFR